MSEELKDKILFALRLYALTTRTEDLEKLGYKVKVRLSPKRVHKHFYYGGHEIAVFKFEKFTTNYTVTTNSQTPSEFKQALGVFLG